MSTKHPPGEKIPDNIAGLHILVTDPNQDDAREQRKLLQQGIDGLIRGWNWQSLRMAHGHRMCAMEDGKPAPPISVSYSGPVALLLVSNDWRAVGVDIEVTSPERRRRYLSIVRDVGGGEAVDPLASFVRAEAWAKATACGFSFGAEFFLGGSIEAGERYDGRVVRDLDLGGHLPAYVTNVSLVAVAVCIDADALEPVIHPARQVSAGGGSVLPRFNFQTKRPGGIPCY